MATVITEECINCGACEPECPNTAIYQGGVEYESQGATHAALSGDFFYIVPEKCTECVGFFDHEACAAVCPVDCCVPDAERAESEEVLLERARALHPDESFGPDSPSRFKQEGAVAGASSPQASSAAGASGAEAGAAGTAVSEPTPTAATSAATAKPKPVTAKPKPAPAPAAPSSGSGSSASAAATGAASGRIEKVVSRGAAKLESGDPNIDFDGELGEDFDSLRDRVCASGQREVSRLAGLALLLASPILGALGDKTKRAIERAYGDRRRFSAQMATGLNVFLDFLFYPVLFYVIGLSRGLVPFTEGDRRWIVVGLLVAVAETLWRLRDGILHSKPPEQAALGPSFYGVVLGGVISPIVGRLTRGDRSGVVPVEGFYSSEFEAKRERERRYGEVYSVEEYDHGYLVRLDMPRVVPASSAKLELGIGDEMPDYDVDMSLVDHRLVVSASVVDPQLRAVCGVSSAFPADFKTEIAFEAPLAGFRHRYQNKRLEVLVLKAAD